MRTTASKLVWLATAIVLAGAFTACQKSEEGAANGGAPGDTTHGKMVFTTTCSTCHGVDGTGVKGLGKDLVHSEFVKKSSEADLVKMVNVGRPVNDPLNTTKIAMPPKGGNLALSDQDVRDAVAFVKTFKPS